MRGMRAMERRGGWLAVCYVSTNNEMGKRRTLLKQVIRWGRKRVGGEYGRCAVIYW
jgi:hypothetical protein